MKIRPFKATYPKTELISSADSFFGSVKMEFPNYYRNGFFQDCEEEAIFVYHIYRKETVHRGIIACSDINDFVENRILKHENTLAAKEQKLINILLQNEGMVKPILMTYPRRKKIDRLMQKVARTPCFLEVNLEESEETHMLWKVSDRKTLARIIEEFEEIDNLYIADGHHRTSTGVRLLQSPDFKGSKDKLLGVYFSTDNLSVYDFNRVIDFHGILSPSSFIAQLSQYCKIEVLKDPCTPNDKHTMGMYLQGEYYKLRWKKKYTSSNDPDRILFDTQLINTYILGDILNIQNVRDNPRISYVSGVDGLEPLLEKTRPDAHTIGLSVYPISLDNLMHEAKHNRTLPPKSTWFEPRIKNGLVVQMF